MPLRQPPAATTGTGVEAQACRLDLLGRFELAGPAGPLDLGGRKLQALVAYLAAQSPRPQRREHLMTLLWGSHFDTQARQNLRQALVRIRKVLPPGILTGTDEHLGIDPACIDVDLWHFERLIGEGSPDALRQAVDLARGPYLDGLDIAEEGFENWVAGERRRIDALHAAARVRLAAHEHEAGRHDLGLEHARLAVRLAPLREDAHRLVMRTCLAVGRRGDALHQYIELERLLREELEATPEPETLALVAELRAPAASDEVAGDTGTGIDTIARPPRAHANQPTAPVDPASATPPVVAAMAAAAPARRPPTSKLDPAAWLTPLLALRTAALGVAAIAGILWARPLQAPAGAGGEQVLPPLHLASVLQTISLEGRSRNTQEPYLVALGKDGLADVQQFALELDGRIAKSWSDRGKWWLEGEVVNLQFPRWSSGRLLQRTVVMQGERFELSSKDTGRMMEIGYVRSTRPQWGAFAEREKSSPAVTWGHATLAEAQSSLQQACGNAHRCTPTILEQVQCAAVAVGEGPAGPVTVTFKSQLANYARIGAASQCRAAAAGSVCRITAFVCADGRHRLMDPM